MGFVFKKNINSPLPIGAEIYSQDGQMVARWKTRAGHLRIAPLIVDKNGTRQIRRTTSKYYLRFYDNSGRMVERPTGCRDESSARAVLAECERRLELVKAGIISAAEDAIADHAQVPIETHLEAFYAHMRAKKISRMFAHDRKRYLGQLCSGLRWEKLSNLERNGLEHWLHQQLETGRSARSVNAYRSAALAFGNWAVRTSRLSSNPFDKIERANESLDRRRVRRALSEEELVRLIAAARTRPQEDALKRNRGRRKGESGARVSEKYRRKLECLGRERALIYKVFVLSGLRRAELGSLRVASLELDAPEPYLVLEAKDEKNRRGSKIPLRADLAVDLQEHLLERLKEAQENAKRIGAPIPVRLPGTAPLFRAPPSLVRAMKRDLKAAGIPERDARGRVVDVHSLRMTFATHLARAGVPLRTAQAALRHSDPRLTANVYTDPQLLDVRGALDVLPAISLGSDRVGDRNLPSTGT